jgi:L-2-hydroxyglutarate oxidase LhgO
MEHLDCVVIGAGVVGLAVARALALAGREVMVLDAANAIGLGASSRSSEVIHAGIYYPAGSLKAQLCVRGKALLYDYCAARHVPHSRCGKFIVATDPSQVAALSEVAAKAAANGVGDLLLLSAGQALVMEPQLVCSAALFSPSTGIIDSHALMLALQADIESTGGVVVLNTAVAQVIPAAAAIHLIATDGFEVTASTVVNAAGLGAQQLANHSALPTRWAKGNYFSLTGKSPFSRLIYPLPEPGGLGVHATLDLGGQTRFGPDVQWVDSPDDLAVDPARGQAFYAEVRKYWPALADGALQPDYAGIRAKLHGPEQPSADFVIEGQAEHGMAGWINLLGIESPGLTSCLAIAERVAELLSNR